ncbi:hypothetical protein PMAYCL1PPCAC_05491, partial [Pristionchus mayeri]
GSLSTAEKPYNMTEEVDGLVKYYTNLIFPSTSEHTPRQREQRPKLPSRSPFRLEKAPPPRSSTPEFSLDYQLPSEDYVDKLPFRARAVAAAASPGYGAAAPAGPVYAAVPSETAAVSGYASSPAAEATTEASTTTTTNGYNVLGWQTDDDGNVFKGDDNAKIYLIQIPPKKYWDPLPKDWPEADWFGSMFPDSKNYRG